MQTLRNLKISAICLLVILFYINVASRGLCQTPNTSTQVATAKSPNPTYNFRVVVQAGETIDGYTIKNFRPEPSGVNVVMNDKGQTAYLADTDKGKVIFRDRSIVATLGTRKSFIQAVENHQPTNLTGDITSPVIDSKGHVAYIEVHVDNKKNTTWTVAIDGKPFLQSGKLIKEIKSKIVAFWGIYYNSSGDLVAGAMIVDSKGARKAAILVNGIYSPKELSRMLAKRSAVFPIYCDNGHVIFMNGLLRNFEHAFYPFRPSIFAMNDKDKIFVASDRNFYVFPYNSALPDRMEDSYSLTIFDKYAISNSDNLIKRSLRSTVVPSNGAVMSIGTKLDTLTNNFINVDHIVLSSRGRGAIINNHDQIAFYVQCFGALTPHSGYTSWGALIVGTPGKPVPDPITLTKATTTDAQNVSVDYVVSQPNIPSIHFDIYRSSTNDVDTTGKQDVTNPDITNPNDLTVGEHKDVKLNLSKGLPPNTAMPYVVVKSTCNGMTDQTYFQKWMLGIVTHGYNFWAINNNSKTKYIPIWSTKIPDWEIAMANDLHGIDGYDDVYQFNWQNDCATDLPGLASGAGYRMGAGIVSHANALKLKSRHAGDVVDLHLIGHSRGAVVVAFALKYLVSALGNGFGGSYVEVTLLDPHPANNYYGEWASFDSDKDGRRSIFGENLYKGIYSFQEAASDERILIPKGIKSFVVWYQKNEAFRFMDHRSKGEEGGNLWGMPEAIDDESGLIDLKKLPIMDWPGGLGHGEVPLLYDAQVVRSGKLNHSPSN